MQIFNIWATILVVYYLHQNRIQAYPGYLVSFRSSTLCYAYFVLIEMIASCVSSLLVGLLLFMHEFFNSVVVTFNSNSFVFLVVRHIVNLHFLFATLCFDTWHLLSLWYISLRLTYLRWPRFILATFYSIWCDIQRLNFVTFKLNWIYLFRSFASHVFALHELISRPHVMIIWHVHALCLFTFRFDYDECVLVIIILYAHCISCHSALCLSATLWFKRFVALGYPIALEFAPSHFTMQFANLGYNFYLSFISTISQSIQTIYKHK